MPLRLLEGEATLQDPCATMEAAANDLVSGLLGGNPTPARASGEVIFGSGVARSVVVDRRPRLTPIGELINSLEVLAFTSLNVNHLDRPLFVALCPYSSIVSKTVKRKFHLFCFLRIEPYSKLLKIFIGFWWIV